MKHIFLACAHAPDQTPLPGLVRELRAIERALAPLHQRRLYELASNRAANTDDIFNQFTNTSDIEVFHYAGHAGGDLLYLEEAGHIKGIAELFGLNRQEDGGQNTLKLVFLNGCATRGQVASLHAAGVAAVIATSTKVNDEAARVLAEQFYTTWATEGRTLDDAFKAATAKVHTIPEAASRDVVFEMMDLQEGDFREAIPWGLYLNPALPDDSIRQWALNQPPPLPEMMLNGIKPNPTQSLRELVFLFKKSAPELRSSRQDPLMALIERLPWIVGTHLRRLFAVEPGRTMAEPSLERLREIIVAYTELTRFMSYLSLSMLWDAIGENSETEPLPFRLIPSQEDYASTDFVFRTRSYFDLLERASNADPLKLKPHLKNFLKEVDTENGLRPGYLLMEEWKQALAQGKERFNSLVQSRAANKPDAEKGLVLEAEAIYAGFLKACLFLTEFKLHTVRSIVVDKIRKLESEQPYSHHLIALHAAFETPKTATTIRETATDNYCLLLSPRREANGPALLNDVINLSPFYLDRSSFIGNNINSYPAVFTLDYQRGEGFYKEYVFHYIDRDINHDYAFAQDNELAITTDGAHLPEHIGAGPEILERFEKIHQQLEQLETDIPQTT
ncbi:MAG: CHAT domain-containing protein [Phaeodactylibacter sp.]|nr:CHAT domain-containing protein [Phaeodactylibacter sp.]MCB9289296.1 CHAT domain-containing protein [Lewinellaceae bacterium]